MDLSFDSVERKSFISLLSLASNGRAPNLMVKADAMRDFALHMHLVNLRHWTAKALQDVEDVRQIHFTTDCWSTPARKNAYISLTGHWMGPAFEMERITFALEEIKGGYGDEELEDAYYQMIARLEFLHVHGHVTVDNGSKNFTLFQAFSKRPEVVFDPRMQLHSTLVQDVTTRWNSTYAMFKRAMALQSSVQHLTQTPDFEKVAVRRRVPDIGNRSSDVFAAEKEVGSGELSYASFNQHIYPSDFLVQVKNSYGASQLEPVAEKMLEKLKKYHSMAVKLDSHYLATILDPRFNLRWFEAPGNWPIEVQVEGHSIIAIKLLFMAEAESLYQLLDSAPPPAEPTSGNRATSLQDEMFGWGEAESSSSSEELKEEVDRYWAQKIVAPSTNPLSWWQVNHQQFPTLARMARSILAIPATSAPSERVFSSGRRILRWDRSALSARSTEALVCLKDFYRKQGFLQIE
ncbi:Zinc finger bed domain-containing protein ricesleeper 2-like [Thalictrum thalictroides]|uniref:Zinc finger bed domain-containing protein ricesleeper 2-like n=1 Tax=Thalictrum thalictroides TaxID=46969 RepID=A0A7J6W0W8_THATH|nr:Zinc finger bed domain-containing protein ricesleeper 2-like [Thalictrum thalictroides]